MEARLAGVVYRVLEQRWWEALVLEGQRAEDLSVDRDGLDPTGTATPAAAICPSPGQDTQSLSRISSSTLNKEKNLGSKMAPILRRETSSLVSTRVSET